MLAFSEDATAQLTWIESPVNGHWYHHTTWLTHAGNGDTYAQTIGGRSATIRNQAEDDWIRATFGGVSSSNGIAWIGLTDSGHEGTLEWESGEPVTFTNFATPPNPNLPGAYWTLLTVTQNPTDPWWELACPSCYSSRLLVEVISDDCDGNGLPDAYEIADGLVQDSNGNGIPDDCDDCNGNGTADVQDISSGTSTDCNGNATPDECDPDCNSNGIPDECDAQDDCNSNGLLDHCEIHSDGSLDLNNNDILDSCECAPAINYCTASPNSVSPTGAQISLLGVTSLTLNNMTLITEGLRPNQFGVYFYGPLKQDPPVSFGDGYRCVSTFDLKRLNPPVATGRGTAQRALDMTATPLNSIQAGDTRYFQFWYRDPGVIGAGYNLTDGLEITFCP